MKKMLLLLALFPLSSVFADDSEPLSRYSFVKTDASPDQKEILNVIIQVSFDHSVMTVGDAIRRLLRRSGYQMASLERSHGLLPVLLDLPLPDVHREMGPITLKEALQILAGPPWRLIVDPVYRLVSFEINDEYHKLYETPLPGVRDDLAMGGKKVIQE